MVCTKTDIPPNQGIHSWTLFCWQMDFNAILGWSHGQRLPDCSFFLLSTSALLLSPWKCSTLYNFQHPDLLMIGSKTLYQRLYHGRISIMLVTFWPLDAKFYSRRLLITKFIPLLLQFFFHCLLMSHPLLFWIAFLAYVSTLDSPPSPFVSSPSLDVSLFCLCFISFSLPQVFFHLLQFPMLDYVSSPSVSVSLLPFRENLTIAH
jgi:hypothetical protein